MLSGFRQFIMRGNVMDLAVAVVIGAAFGAVVTSLVTNILTPFIAAIFGKPDFSAFTIRSGAQVRDPVESFAGSLGHTSDPGLRVRGGHHGIGNGRLRGVYNRALNGSGKLG